MKNSIITIFYATSMGLALLAGASFVTVLAVPSSALAKDNNGNRGNSGALNAGRANANAQANASSNSRIGLIQVYEAAVMATSTAQQTYEVVLAEWTAFNGFESGFDSFPEFSEAYTENPTGLEEDQAYWQAYAALATASSNLNYAREIEEMALQLAANKDTDEATIARLWDLLGL